ncbi:TPA: hypothetical protein ACYSAQ_000614 [Morganella morganii]
MGTIDWALVVAIIAVIVGVGSLVLTWQSTMAAKRAIDTSVDIYEKQKKDSIIEKKSFDDKKLEAIKIVIAYEITIMYLNHIKIMSSFEIIKKNDNFIVYPGLRTSSDVIIDAQGDGNSSFNTDIPKISCYFSLLYDIKMLDELLALEIMGMNRATIEINNTLKILNFIVNNNTDNNEKRKQIKEFVNNFNNNFINYDNRLKDLWDKCITTASLESMVN